MQMCCGKCDNFQLSVAREFNLDRKSLILIISVSKTKIDLDMSTISSALYMVVRIRCVPGNVSSILFEFQCMQHQMKRDSTVECPRKAWRHLQLQNE